MSLLPCEEILLIHSYFKNLLQHLTHQTNLEPMVRLELTTSPLPRVCSTPEPHGPRVRGSNKAMPFVARRSLVRQPLRGCLRARSSRLGHGFIRAAPYVPPN